MIRFSTRLGHKTDESCKTAELTAKITMQTCYSGQTLFREESKMENYWDFSTEQYWPITPSFDPACTCYRNTPYGVSTVSSQDPVHYDCSKDKQQSFSFVGHSGSSQLNENDNTTPASEHCSSSATDKVEMVPSTVSSNLEAQATKVDLKRSSECTENKPSASGKAVKQRKTRTLFSPGQINVLEQVFSQYHYIASSQRKLLAQKIGISEAQVRVWFQNRRIKWRKEGKEFLVKCENN